MCKNEWCRWFINVFEWSGCLIYILHLCGRPGLECVVMNFSQSGRCKVNPSLPEFCWNLHLLIITVSQSNAQCIVCRLCCHTVPTSIRLGPGRSRVTLWQEMYYRGNPWWLNCRRSSGDARTRASGSADHSTILNSSHLVTWVTCFELLCSEFSKSQAILNAPTCLLMPERIRTSFTISTAIK